MRSCLPKDWKVSFAMTDGLKGARMLRSGTRLWLSCLIVVLAAAAGRAEEETGQAALDKATEARLSAETLGDLNQCVELCREAIQKGLDESNIKFAQELLASSLAQRGELACLELFERPSTPARARRLLETAISDLEEAVKLNSEQPEAQFLLGRLYSHLGKNDQAVTALNEAIRLADSDPGAKSKALLIRAGVQTSADARQADYDEAVKLAPQEANALRFRGMNYLMQNNPKLAIADFDAAIKVDPNQPESYEARGLAQAMTQDLDGALESFNKVIELEPNSPSALVQRARVRATKGDIPGAVVDVEQSMKLRPGSVQALLLHANLLGTQGKFETALSELNVLRQVMPDNVELLYQLGIMYQADHQPKKALEALDHLLAQEPQNSLALRGRADAYLNLGQQDKAIADYEEALKIDPKDTGMLNNLAWLLATSPDEKLRNGKRSIELAKEACELTEYKAAHILSTLAASYAETGDFDTAIDWSQKAVALGDEKTKVNLEQELKSYRDKKPWREALPPEASEAEKTAQPQAESSPSEQDTARTKRGS
jgi:tetratricopeptide (TPR) repeat protein